MPSVHVPFTESKNMYSKHNHSTKKEFNNEVMNLYCLCGVVPSHSWTSTDFQLGGLGFLLKMMVKLDYRLSIKSINKKQTHFDKVNKEVRKKQGSPRQVLQHGHIENK